MTAMRGREQPSLPRVSAFEGAPPPLQRALQAAEENTARTTRKLEIAKTDTLRSTPMQRSAYTAQLGELVLCDPAAGAFTVTLPKLDREHHGQTLTVKHATASATAITIRGAAGQTIDGQASVSISAYGSARLVADDQRGWWRT